MLVGQKEKLKLGCSSPFLYVVKFISSVEPIWVAVN